MKPAKNSVSNPPPSHCQSFCQGFVSLLRNPTPPGFCWPSVHHFLVATARVMPPAVLSVKRGRMKECYRNATMAALRQTRLIYCEGYAMPDLVPIPMEHAWLYDPEAGRVVETTWEQPGLDYYGIAFTRDYLRIATMRRKYYGLIYAFTRDYCLLRMSAEELATVMHPAMNSL